MKKNVLCSLVALSAVPMAAFADANISSLLQTGVPGQWGTADQGVVWDNDICVSQFGNPMQNEIKNLAPGKYTFEAKEVSNAVITVNGQKVVDNKIVVDLKSEGSISVVVTAAKAGELFRAGGFSLNLNYDFAAEGQKYYNQALYEHNKVDALDHQGPDFKALSVPASKIQDEWLAVVAANNKEEAYALYKKHELWKGDDNKLAIESRELAKLINQAAANKKVYDDNKAAYDAMMALTIDFKGNKYATNFHKAALAELVKGREVVKDFADYQGKYNDNAYEVRFSQTVNLAKMKADYVAKYKALQAKVDHSIQCDLVYQAIIAEQNNVRDAYLHEQEVLMKLMLNKPNGANEGEDVNQYKPLLDKAAKELADHYNWVHSHVDFKSLLGNADNHENAVKNEAKMRELIANAKTKIAATSQQYNDWYLAEFAAFKNAMALVDQLNAGLKAVPTGSVYESERKGVQDQIDALNQQIHKDNQNFFAVKDKNYETNKKAIETATSKFAEKVGVDLANLNAFKTLRQQIADLNKALSDAKVVVGKLAKVGDYVANDYNTTAAIEKKIAAENTKVGENYSKDKKYATLTVDFKGISDLIKKYQEYAEQSHAKYDDLYKKVTADEKALNELKAAAKDWEEVIVGNDNTKTYADHIQAYETALAEVQKAMAAACQKKDKLHFDALYKIVYDGQEVAIKADKTNFAKDKENHISNLQVATAQRLWQGAVDLLKEKQTDLDAVQKKIDTEDAGIQEAKFQERLNDLQKEVNAQKAKVDKYTKETITNENANEASALLKQVHEDLKNKVNSEQLVKDLDARIKFVAENNNFHKNLFAVKGDMKLLQDAINLIKSNNKDASRNAEFEALYNKVQAGVDEKDLKLIGYNELKKKVDKAKADEVMIAWWNEEHQIQAEPVKKEKALKEFCAEHKQKAEEFAALATASTQNWNKYNDIQKVDNDLKFNDVFAEITKKIQQDGVTVGKVTLIVGQDAANYYVNTVIVNLKKKLEQIRKDYKASYDAPKREMVAKFEGYKTQLTELQKEIKALENEAFQNQRAYNAMLGKEGKLANGAKIYQLWDKVYDRISATDKNPVRDQALEDLITLQKNLDQLVVDVKVDFGAGNCDDNESVRNEEYTRIETAIQAIDSKYSEGYDEAILKANEVYKKEIMEAYNKGLEEFKAGAKLYEEYRVLKDDALRRAMVEILQAAEAIYPTFDELNAEKAAFEKGYDAMIEANKTAAEKHVYDYPEKQHLANLKAKTAKIKALADEMRERAKEQAVSVLTEQQERVQGLLDAAVAKLVYNGKAYATKDKAFKPQRDLLAEAAKLLKVDFVAKYDYVVDLDNARLLANMRLVEAKSFDFEAAADAEWAHFIKAKDEKIAKDQKALDEFIYPEHQPNVKQEYKKNYNDALKPYYYADDKFEVERTPNVSFANLEVYVNEAQAAYDAAQHIFNQAQNLCVNTKKSDAAYENLMKGTANKEYQYAEFKQNAGVVDAKIAELKAYADVYVIALNDPWKEAFVQRVFNAQANLKSQMDLYKKEGGVHNLYDYFRGQMTAHLETIGKVGTGLFKYADDLMIASLQNDGIPGFKHEYNLAIVAGLASDRLNHYADLIQKAEKELAAIEKLAQGKRHDRLVALQESIAKSIQELSKEYGRQDLDKTMAELKNAVADVNAKMTALNGFYEEAHGVVRQQFVAELASAQAAVDQAVKYTNEKEAEGQLLFFSENIKKLTATALEAVENLDGKMKRLEAKYDTHDKFIADKKAEFDAAKKNYNRVVELWNSYKYRVDNKNYQKEYDRCANLVEKWLDARSYGHDDVYTEFATATTVVPNIADLKANTDVFEIEAAKFEFDKRMFDLNNAIRTAGSYLYDKEYIDADAASYADVYRSIDYARIHVDNYFTKLYVDGETSVDIDGKEVAKPIVGFLKHYAEALQRQREIEEQVGSKDAPESLLGKLEANYIVKGDADADKEVSATDFSGVVEYALNFDMEAEVPKEGEAGRLFARVDVNSDNLVNVGDVVRVGNFIIGPSEVKNVMNLMAQPLNLRALAEDQLSVAVEGEGTSQRIAIRLNNSSNYVAGQMDIQLPAGVTLLGESVGEGASQHDLYSADLSNGSHRVILANLGNVSFDGNGEAMLYLDVQVSHNFKGEGIVISNVQFSDTGGRVYNLKSIGGGEATGIGSVTVVDELKSKIYNVGGQLMNGLKKGVNIIRNSDGTTKKVVK